MRLCGIDEAGRGPLAGPLVMVGVALHENIAGLDDSKKLSEKKREQLYELIIQKSEYKIVFVDNEYIDTHSISKAIKYALEEIKSHFGSCRLLFDGNCTFGVGGIETMIKADAKIHEVSAASILAKVSRDRYMLEAAITYPQYAFEKHKGYGTALHYEMIERYGMCALHRRSYLRAGVGG